MLESNQRYAFFYDLHIETLPDAAEKFSDPLYLEDIIPDLEARFDAKQCYKEYQNGRVGMRILDMQTEGEYLVLLIAYADIQSADPAFMHIVTGNTRTETKNEGEGGAFSAHFVIKKEPRTITPYTYTAVMEKVPGATKSTILPFLNSQMREASTFQYRNKQKKVIHCYPRFYVFGHMGRKFKDVIETGELKDVELISNEYSAPGLDDELEITNISRSLKIDVGPKVTGQAAINFVNRLKEWGEKENIHEYRVHFKGETKNESFKTPNLSTDVGEFSMVRYEVINLENQAGQLETKIRADIVDKIVELRGFGG